MTDRIGQILDRSDDTLDRYSKTTGLKWTSPLAVAFPETVEDVIMLIEYAKQQGFSLHPISRGKNWGYGDACAPTDGQVIVDFKKMNRIIEVNSDLAYAVIEPGVTQQQLYTYLETHHPTLMHDVTGAGYEASIVGNVLERGYGHTRYGDHFANIADMQIVLADGRILNTGFGHFQNARAAHTFRYGLGPVLDGLFSQSNCGIVTKMCIWLMQKPEAFSAVFFQAKDWGQFKELLTSLRYLRLQGVIQSSVHLGNALRAAYARKRDLPKGVLNEREEQSLQKRLRMGLWIGSAGLYGSKETVHAARNTLRRVLKPFEVRCITLTQLSLVERAAAILSKFGTGESLAVKAGLCRSLVDLLLGIPTNAPLHGVSESVGDSASFPVEPLSLRTGLVWISPLCPNTPQDAVRVLEILKPIYHEHGFNMPATFTMVNERSLCCITNICFDKTDKDEAARAASCRDTAYERLVDEGYLPYRAGIDTYRFIQQTGDVFWDVAGRVKQILDPDEIISRGKYIPGKG